MITIGVCGPIDLRLLDWDVQLSSLPQSNAFPLTSHFINALVKRGYKVIGYTNSRDVSEPAVIKSENITVCISRERPHTGRRFFRFEIDDLKEMIHAYPADVIHAFWTYEYALAALESKIPSVVSIHDVAGKILLKQPDLFRAVRWIMNLQVLQKANILVANSDYTYSQLPAATRAKTTVIPNFYPESFETIRAPVSGKGNYIISSSNGFSRRKNTHLALEAFRHVRRAFPETAYYLVGVDMQENGPAHQYAKRKGLAEGVCFLGPMPYAKVLQVVAGAKVLLSPSMEESFGMAVLEAMVVGTAVVGGEKSGFVPSLLNKGKTGVLCNIYSPEAMAGAVSGLLEDNEKRARLELDAITFAKKCFSEEVIIRQHLSLFEKLIPTRSKLV